MLLYIWWYVITEFLLGDNIDYYMTVIYLAYDWLKTD
jgi:hypothetical protein